MASTGDNIQTLHGQNDQLRQTSSSSPMRQATEKAEDDSRLSYASETTSRNHDANLTDDAKLEVSEPDVLDRLKDDDQIPTADTETKNTYDNAGKVTEVKFLSDGTPKCHGLDGVNTNVSKPVEDVVELGQEMDDVDDSVFDEEVMLFVNQAIANAMRSTCMNDVAQGIDNSVVVYKKQLDFIGETEEKNLQNPSNSEKNPTYENSSSCKSQQTGNVDVREIDNSVSATDTLIECQSANANESSHSYPKLYPELPPLDESAHTSKSLYPTELPHTEESRQDRTVESSLDDQVTLNESTQVPFGADLHLALPANDLEIRNNHNKPVSEERETTTPKNSNGSAEDPQQLFTFETTERHTTQADELSVNITITEDLKITKESKESDNTLAAINTEPQVACRDLTIHNTDLISNSVDDTETNITNEISNSYITPVASRSGTFDVTLSEADLVKEQETEPASDIPFIGASSGIHLEHQLLSKAQMVDPASTIRQGVVEGESSPTKEVIRGHTLDLVQDIVVDEAVTHTTEPTTKREESISRQTDEESGLALVNDKLRIKIAELQAQIKQLCCELAFVGDRNWRLEAYMDCLIHTLEKMNVTDVEDLDHATLPLGLFKVKVKAGYRLGPYNGLPQRARRSYQREGRTPPTIDLSGGSISKQQTEPADSTDLPFNISPTDDIGLSVKQMQQYETRIETLVMQNHFLQTQLQQIQSSSAPTPNQCDAFTNHDRHVIAPPPDIALTYCSTSPGTSDVAQNLAQNRVQNYGVPFETPPQGLSISSLPIVPSHYPISSSAMYDFNIDYREEVPSAPPQLPPLPPMPPSEGSRPYPSKRYEYDIPPRFMKARQEANAHALAYTRDGRPGLDGSYRYKNEQRYDGWNGRGRSSIDLGSGASTAGWRRTERGHHQRYEGIQRTPSHIN